MMFTSESLFIWSEHLSTHADAVAHINANGRRAVCSWSQESHGTVLSTQIYQDIERVKWWFGVHMATTKTAMKWTEER